MKIKETSPGVTDRYQAANKTEEAVVKRTPPPPTRRRRRNITREYETNRTRDHHFTAGFCLAFWAPPRLAAAAASVGSSDPTSPIGRSCQWPPNLTLVVIGDAHGAGEAMSGSVGRRRSPAAVRHGGVRAPPRSDKVMERPNSKIPAMKASSSNAAAPQMIMNRSQSRRDRKIALQQDVDKLRKKLRHEENVHRALERAFTRPLGALPRLPPYLPSQTLELLAEVAVLEEEVVRLEEQVVSFRQGLYEEAVTISMAKSAYFSDTDRCTPARHGQVPDQAASASWSSLKRVTNVKQTPRRTIPSMNHGGDRPGKENQSCTTNSFRDHSRFPLKTVPKCSNPEEEKCADFQMRSSSDQDEDRSSSPSVSGSCESSDGAACAGDPYGVLELGSRDIGPYKQFRAVDATSFDQNVFDSSNSLLGRRLNVYLAKIRALLQKLSSVDLVGLSHQQKLAFWINTYNSCMMNAFLEHGAPTTPQTLVAMMPKATINVGGRVLSAMTIEHFILRLPYNAKHVNPKGVKSRNGAAAAARGVFGLDWPEPSVTFALSCGSWSSPAVRVYTACHVEDELEAAKRDYLQAAVGVSTATSISIPKLLHWYLLDFTKDVSSLMDWVCLQLPGERRRHAVEAVEASRRSPSPPPVQVVPYEFRFRYLLAT
uniref:Ternary complex factor MIP1 leucine-zipper domain-containing protein n=1 Tax=Oryza glumipatula TaxID=40148 RepID=A0A0E0AWK1_9ORYZ